jgi:copper homeostasis protein
MVYFYRKHDIMILEACVESYEEALKAQSYGAHRIELCSQLDLDGLTPSPDLVRKVCNTLNIPVMVMIRPRGGDFHYTEEEIISMIKDIKMANESGAEGVVFGVLTQDNFVDVVNCIRLTAAAGPLQVTFHKAIDSLADPAEGVRQLMDVRGITRVLSSGGAETAFEGKDKIREMIKETDGRITILVAGKVTNENIYEIASITGAIEFHGRKIVGSLI